MKISAQTSDPYRAATQDWHPVLLHLDGIQSVQRLDRSNAKRQGISNVLQLRAGKVLARV